jgi:hypothetical protein
LNGTFVFLAMMDIHARSISFAFRPKAIWATWGAGADNFDRGRGAAHEALDQGEEPKQGSFG